MTLPDCLIFYFVACMLAPLFLSGMAWVVV